MQRSAPPSQIATRRFDLDDICTEICQSVATHPAVLVGEVEDAIPYEYPLLHTLLAGEFFAAVAKIFGSRYREPYTLPSFWLLANSVECATVEKTAVYAVSILNAQRCPCQEESP
jgi:hypothetical protein